MYIHIVLIFNTILIIYWISPWSYHQSPVFKGFFTLRFVDGPLPRPWTSSGPRRKPRGHAPARIPSQTAKTGKQSLPVQGFHKRKRRRIVRRHPRRALSYWT